MNSANRNTRRHTSRKSSQNDVRSPAQKDRDRILYSSSLRRLAQVTQVISADVGHVFHNRLTHSLQVAQVGRRMAERLLKTCPGEVEVGGGIDPDVVEAACCAHDLGHPPFGHTAEVQLNKLAGADIDGFEGNAQSFRIVTRLAQHSADHRGLDLTRATLAAILKYPWFRGQSSNKPFKWGAYRSEAQDFEFARLLGDTSLEPTLEAQLMDWADDITYSVHDLDDFFRAHKIPLHLFADRTYRLQRTKFIEAAERRNAGEPGFWTDKSLANDSLLQIFGGLFKLSEPYTGSWKERAFLREFTSVLIGRYVQGTTLVERDGKIVLSRSEDLIREVAILKELTWIYVIEAPSLTSQQFGQRRVVETLFDVYMNAASPTASKLFPVYYRDMIDEAGHDEREIRRAVIDLIAGMTEAQALTMFRRLTGVSVGSGLEEIVG